MLKASYIGLLQAMQRGNKMIICDTEYASIEQFLEANLTLKIEDLDDFFRYHPSQTDARKELHELINKSTTDTAKQLICLIGHSREKFYWERIINNAISNALECCQQPICLQYAIAALRAIDKNQTSILMGMQQYKMFLNQGITLDKKES
jgi:hypothetical protein